MSTSSLGLAFKNMNTSSQKGGIAIGNSNIPMVSSQHLVGPQNMSVMNNLATNKFHMCPIEDIRLLNDDKYFQSDHHRNRSPGEFIGQKKNDMRHGYGQIWYENGDYYAGYWEQNQPHGDGVLIFAQSEESSNISNSPKLMYSGNFQKGYFHGFGKLFTAFNANQGIYIYVGYWKNGKRQNYGIQYYNQNQKTYYFGLWNNDMRSGQGKLFFENGQFEGQWKDNKMHGHGTLTMRQGRLKTKTIGIWNQDQIESGQIAYVQLKTDSIDSSRLDSQQEIGLYKGQISNYLRHGEGWYQIEDKGYHGKFLIDKIVGIGQLKGIVGENKYQLKADFSNQKLVDVDAMISYWNNDHYKGKSNIDDWVIKRTQGQYQYSNKTIIKGKFIDNPQGKLKGSFQEIR